MDRDEIDLEAKIWLYKFDIDKPGAVESLSRLLSYVKKKSQPPAAPQTSTDPQTTGSYNILELERLLEECR